MKARALIWFGLSLAVASACSSSDQSLGETRATPQPDVDPDPPDPTPDPNPDAPVGPCEDRALHANIGDCLPEVIACPGELITRTGYECPVGLHCCGEGKVGCGPNGEGCGGAASGPVLPPGGFGGAG